MLQEEKRKQLDAIVQRMVANKESDENIQAVVADFKQKYAQTTPTESKNKLPLIDRAINTGAKVTDTIFGGGKIGEALAGGDVSGKELAGSALQSASLFFPAGRAAKIGTQAARYLGMRGASKAIGAIGAGALGGYGFDVATNLQQEKEGAEVLTPGIGTAIGGGIPAVGAAASGAKKLVVKFGEDQGPRVINSLIKPLLKDFSYGKNPGRAVAEEGIIANNFDDLEKAIRTRRQEVGREIGELGRTISTKPEIQVRESLSVLDDAMKEAASLNNPTLLQRLQQVKRAITDNLVPELDETGNIVIKSAGARNLDNLTFEEARRVLTEIGDMTQFTGNPSDDKLVNSTLKRIYGSIKQATLDNARKTNPELAKRFEELTEKYADLSSAEIATKYRDKILERQNLVGLNPKMTGIASGLVTLVATGGATAPAVLVGIGGATLDNLMSSPGFKTRLAAMLSKKTAGELDTIFSKVPALKKVFPKDEIQFPGDVLFDKVDDALKDIPNKQGGFVAVPKLGGSADDLVNQAKKYKTAEEFVKAQPVVYHGSHTPLKKFSNERGTFFTDDMMNAEGYASGENVYEGYLNLKNPLIIDANGALHRELDTKWGKTTQEVVGNVDKTKYDGVIFKNIKDSWIDDAEVDTPSTIYYAFKPKDSFLNESQLTDIWKKAHSGADDLVTQAKKYKTVEEFVTAQGAPVYHGSPEKFDNFDLGKAGSKTDSGMFGKGIYFTDSRGEAYGYSRGTGNIKEVYLDLKNPYIIKTGKDIPDIKVPTKTIEDLKKTDVNYSEAFTKYLMERGYDGVIDEMSATKQYVVFDPSQIKTRSQLTDIWKKANNK